MEWIKSSDALPEKHGYYLVFKKCVAKEDSPMFNIGDFVDIAYYNPDTFLFSIVGSEDDVFNMLLSKPVSYGQELTHWMPLPDPPTE